MGIKGSCRQTSGIQRKVQTGEGSKHRSITMTEIDAEQG
jgi:hypothetical protein